MFEWIAYQHYLFVVSQIKQLFNLFFCAFPFSTGAKSFLTFPPSLIHYGNYMLYHHLIAIQAESENLMLFFGIIDYSKYLI